MKRQLAWRVFGLVWVMAASASAQIVPAGARFQISGDAPNLTGRPAVATDAAGRALVVWGVFEDNPVPGEPDSNRIFGRFYDTEGEPVSAPQAIDGGPVEYQFDPDVTAAGRNRFLVVWSRWDFEPGADAYDVYSHLLDGRGGSLRSRLLINNRTFFWQISPAATANRRGDVFVVWATGDVGDQGPWPLIVGGRRLLPDGRPSGREIRVNDLATSPVDYVQYQSRVGVAADPAGESMTVWASGYRIFARRYDRQGRPRGGEVRVDTEAGRQSGNPAVAADAHGNFLVLWESLGVFPPVPEIRARAFDRNGAAGPEQTAGVRATRYGAYPSVTSDSEGRFVAAWTVVGGDPLVALRRLGPDGAPRGNLRIAGRGAGVDLAAGPDGDVLVVWVDRLPDQDLRIYGRRFRVQ